MSIVHILQADLELTGPAAIAAPETTTVGSVLRPDLPLSRDGWDRPYIPATSLAGSLRQQARPSGAGSCSATSPANLPHPPTTGWALRLAARSRPRSACWEPG